MIRPPHNLFHCRRRTQPAPYAAAVFEAVSQARPRPGTVAEARV
jgi:hypothetical protein